MTIKRNMKDTWLEQTINNLTLLKDAFANEEIGTMVYDGDEEDKIEELQNLINYLNEKN